MEGREKHKRVTKSNFLREGDRREGEGSTRDTSGGGSYSLQGKGCRRENEKRRLRRPK